MKFKSLFKSKEKEFMELYEPIHERFARYCDVKTKSKEEAKDLVNDTLIIAFEKFNEIREKKSLLYFLFGTAHNIYLNQQRRNKFKGEYTEELEINTVDSGIDPERQTDINLFYEKLAQLDSETEEIIILKEISGFQVKEVASIMNLTVSNVKVKLHRGRIRLKELYREPQL